MAPSSSFRYDVFLSFRGKDTRCNFTSHLHKALRDKQIQAFVDEELNRGDEISPTLRSAIQDSQISVVILSKDYADSRWCLDELTHILDCKKKYKQIVIPVYYNIDPSDVRRQTGTFAAAFEKHVECFEGGLVKIWRNSLTDVANLSGYDSRVFKLESQLIEELVEDILKRLNDMSPSDNSDLVGIASKIEQMESLLRFNLTNVRVIGIWGIGGIGKTTLASAVFNKISNQFDGSYFIQNVKKESEKCGSMCWQQELLSTILGDGNVNVGTSVIERMFTKKRLARKKLLVVFDDVTDFRQVEFLIESLCGHPSSNRIIITTRDQQTLKNCRVEQIYEVEPLSHHEALELFCRYAFKKNHPALNYEELSNEVVKFAGGIPLALKILGSFLLDKKIEVWKSAMDKLKRCFHMDIQNVLKISYDELDDEMQNIFLDIACFFKGKDYDLVKKILNASGFFVEIGISALIDKSMITITDYNKIIMHDLLQAMGREIVRQESIDDPGKRTRLWNHEDIYRVLKKNTGTEIIECISLDLAKIRDIHLDRNTFTKMHKLRFLELYSSSYEEDANKVHIFQGLESAFIDLKYLHWHGYPLKSLPSNFHLENLVILEMPYSNVENLWNSFQHLDKLKEINLRCSKHLTNCPDLSGFPNLESLILVGCTSLLEIPSSVQYLHKLDILDLTDCKSLGGLPNCIHLKSLRKLYLSGCSNLKMLPEISCSIEELYLDETAIEELPPSIENLCRLVLLDLKTCSRLKNLPESICRLKSLKRLILSDCSTLEKLPDDLGTLESLLELEVEGTAVGEVPSSIFCLNVLKVISFGRYCRNREMVGLNLPLFNLPHLVELDLANCGIMEIPDSLGNLSSLERLYLCGNKFLSIPSTIRYLSNLSELHICNCDRLQLLPDLPLILIDAHDCIALEESSCLQVLDTIVTTDEPSIFVNFVNCLKLHWSVHENIVDDVLFYMQCLATFWKEEYYDKGCNKTPRAGICYPGSEIPNWFQYRSTESSITVEPKQDWFNSNFVGFALCIVVAFRDHQDYDCGFTVHCDCKHWCVAHSTFDDWVSCRGEPCYIDSHYVFMGFDFNLYPSNFANSHCNEVSFQFYVEHRWSDKSMKCCWVKKCGVSLMYTQDAGKVNGSFCLQEKKEEPNPKKLKPCWPVLTEIIQLINVNKMLLCSFSSLNTYLKSLRDDAMQLKRFLSDFNIFSLLSALQNSGSFEEVFHWFASLFCMLSTKGILKDLLDVIFTKLWRLQTSRCWISHIQKPTSSSSSCIKLRKSYQILKQLPSGTSNTAYLSQMRCRA